MISRIANVGDPLENERKRLRLDRNSPIYDLPMKADVIYHINEQDHEMKYGKTTAVFGFPFYKGTVAHSREEGDYNIYHCCEFY